MKLKRIHIQNQFKRFTDLTIDGLQPTVKLVVLTGPNGCGKTSLFEAFSICQAWEDHTIGMAFDPNYHSTQPSMSATDVVKQIHLEFHDASDFPKLGERRKYFYIRSAYRHEADINVKGSVATNTIQRDAKRPLTMVLADERVSENYLHWHDLAAGSCLNLRKQSLDEVVNTRAGALELRDAIKSLFDDLMFDGVSDNSTSPGTFTFTKGESNGFHYINLSGGEKAAFDLLLDFIIKREVFNDTVYCIDEPELHMHSRLQAKLLGLMFDLIPDNCQLWIATHSIGMARKAAELYKDNPDQVAFIDFSDYDFKKADPLKPITPNRLFWDKMFKTALDDLGSLVAPEHVVFCEGARLDADMWKPSFDATVYSKIFGDEFPFVKFIPLGGKGEVKTYSKMFGAILEYLIPGGRWWILIDRDANDEEDIKRLQKKGVQVLKLRDLENYLWSEEILRLLYEKYGQPDKVDKLLEDLEERRKTLSEDQHKMPPDDIKRLSSFLYNKCIQYLGMFENVDDDVDFAIKELAILVKPETETYKQLKAIVMAPISDVPHDSH